MVIFRVFEVVSLLLLCFSIPALLCKYVANAGLLSLAAYFLVKISELMMNLWFKKSENYFGLKCLFVTYNIVVIFFSTITFIVISRQAIVAEFMLMRTASLVVFCFSFLIEDFLLYPAIMKSIYICKNRKNRALWECIFFIWFIRW